MKRILSLAMGAALVAPLLLFTVVTAHETGVDHPPEEEVFTTTSTSPAQVQAVSNESAAENESEIEATASDKRTLQARLDKRKNRVKPRLSTAEQNSIKSKCKPAQGNISSLRGRIKGIETSRTQVYQNLLDRLNKASELLSTNGADVTELNTQITELEAKMATFNTSLTEYKETVTDLAAMDCAADPASFKASLETARAAKASLKTQSVEIKTYLKDTIRPTLTELRSQLNQDDSTEEVN